jgi:hypothetical protein
MSSFPVDALENLTMHLALVSISPLGSYGMVPLYHLLQLAINLRKTMNIL